MIMNANLYLYCLILVLKLIALAGRRENAYMLLRKVFLLKNASRSFDEPLLRVYSIMVF